jgi:DNA-binding XRE family transcriptional regulator
MGLFNPHVLSLQPTWCKKNHFQMTPEQCRAARMYFDLSREDLAKKARVGRNTVARFETGTGINESTRIALETYFSRIGVQFPDDHTIIFPKAEDGVISAHARKRTTQESE